MFLALLLTWGQDTDLGVVLMGVLLFIDYRQLFGLGNRKAAILTLRTGLYYLLLTVGFYAILTIGLIVFAIANM